MKELTKGMVTKYFGKEVAWVNRVGRKHGRNLYCATFIDGTDKDFYYDFGEIEEDK